MNEALRGSTNAVPAWGDRAPAVELPSTAAQLELWLSDRSGQGAGLAHNASLSLRLHGDVDENALAEALQTLTEFHEALRGHFSADGLRFVIEARVDLPIARHDLSVVPEDQRPSVLDTVRREEGSRPYDLERGPLARAAIIRLAGDTVMVILSTHQAVADGPSRDVLLADLGQIYSAYVSGTPLPAPPGHGFSDFVRYQSAPENAPHIEESRAFWRRRFASLPPSLTLPHDGRRPALRSYGAHHLSMSLAPGGLAPLKAFAQAANVSLSSLLLSGYAILLHRLSGAPDLIVGVPVEGHPRAGMEDCVGPLASLVPVRFDFSSPSSFQERCRQTDACLRDAVQHAWVGVGEIIRDLRIPRDADRVPFVPVTFTHAKQRSAKPLAFGSCEVEAEPNPRAFETFELGLVAIEAGDDLSFQVHANSDLYSPSWTMWRLRELVTLLERACAAPDTAIGDLPVLPPSELELVRDKLNETAAEYPREAGLATLFESQADRSPERTAIRFGDILVSYAELESRANRLARALRRRGIGRGQLVGICVHRSPDMVVAMLATLKAGAGYIPLDPVFPTERLAYMIEDARLALVISQSQLAPVHGCAPDRTFNLDTATDELAEQSSERLPLDGQSAHGDDLAYVLYTSGSTGKPKGVAIAHRATVNLLTSMARVPGLAPDDRVLAITTLSFDIAVVELMLPLTVGAQIVLATREQAIDAEALRRLVENEGVTLAQATPTTWRLLLASEWKGSPSLRGICGGEPLPLDLAGALLGKLGELWNFYGPTETTVWSTGGRVESPDQGITVGRPIANTVIRIVDERLRLCPIGMTGEICIGGDGVALGYLNRPELTAERFIPDPHDPRPGARLYRTGDLGRWRSDGELECLGRVDLQVKIRGFRIELGEIETVLGGHPSVEQAVVTPREERPGDVRLVAYIKPNGAPPDATALRAHLRESLPEYMVPQHFVTVASFPTTPNGKIDRKALPAPDLKASSAASRPTRRLSPVEEQVAALWTELLQRPSIAPDDNFFDLGGHSLMAVALIAEIKKRTGVALTLSQILHTPTLSGLAQAICAHDATEPELVQADSKSLVEMRPGGEQPLFFIYDGLGEVLPYRNLARRLPARYHVYGITPRSLPGVPLAHGSIEDMARACVEEMQRKQPAGPYVLAGLCAGGVIAFAVTEQLERQGHQVAHVILLDAIAPTTAVRRWRIAAQRWARFSQSLQRAMQSAGSEAGPRPAGPRRSKAVPMAALTAAWHKIKGAASYEALRAVRSTSVNARFRLLRYLLDHERGWPAWLPSLTVQETCDCASKVYRPGRVKASLILVRASDGADSDEPAIEQVVDPMLGWGECSTAPLAVIDATGGHSSMLQEPYVDSLAEKLARALYPSTPTPLVGVAQASAK